MAQHLMVPLQMATKATVPRAHAATQHSGSSTLIPSSGRAQETGLSLLPSSVDPIIYIPDVLGIKSLRQLCLDPWSNWPTQATFKWLQGPPARAQVATTCWQGLGSLALF